MSAALRAIAARLAALLRWLYVCVIQVTCVDDAVRLLHTLKGRLQIFEPYSFDAPKACAVLRHVERRSGCVSLA